MLVPVQSGVEKRWITTPMQLDGVQACDSRFRPRPSIFSEYDERKELPEFLKAKACEMDDKNNVETARTTMARERGENEVMPGDPGQSRSPKSSFFWRSGRSKDDVSYPR